MLLVKKQNPLAPIKEPKFLIRSVLFVVYCAFLFSAIATVELRNLPVIILLNYLWPSFTLFFSLLFFKQPYKLIVLLLGTTLVIAGISIEVFHSEVYSGKASFSGALFPYITAFIGAILWGLYSALNRRWGEKAGGVLGVPLILILTAEFFLILKLYFGEPTNITPDIVGPLVYLGFIPLIANVCWDLGIRLGNITILSLLSDFVPWAALTITALYLKVPVGSATFVSAVLIVLGAVISRYSLRT